MHEFIIVYDDLSNKQAVEYRQMFNVVRLSRGCFLFTFPSLDKSVLRKFIDICEMRIEIRTYLVLYACYLPLVGDSKSLVYFN